MLSYLNAGFGLQEHKINLPTVGRGRNLKTGKQQNVNEPPPQNTIRY